jgi:hypothetical protein
MKHPTHLLVASLCIFLVNTARADWWTNSDDNPRQVAPGVWRFSIKIPVVPVGQLQFVNAQYDFVDFVSGTGTLTDGISVDYTYNGRGVDWTEDSALLAVAPTLFELNVGYIQGWSGWDLVNGKFEGTVYATAPLRRVSFTVVADQLVFGSPSRELKRASRVPFRSAR